MSRLLMTLISVAFAAMQHAPNEHALTKRFDAAVLEVMPGARVEVQPVGLRSTDAAQSYYEVSRRWLKRDSSIRARYTIAESVELARERFDVLTKLLQVGSAPIEGIGDEARVLEPAPSGERRLNFRRGRVVVQLTAPGPGDEVVRRLAKLLVDQVDRSSKARELDIIP
jgi:hypothetical protein